jgi:uncharacterized membrane protein
MLKKNPLMHSERDILKASKNNKERIKMTPFAIVITLAVIATIVAVYLFCKYSSAEDDLKITVSIVSIVCWLMCFAYFDYEHVKENESKIADKAYLEGLEMGEKKLPYVNSYLEEKYSRKISGSFRKGYLDGIEE